MLAVVHHERERRAEERALEHAAAHQQRAEWVEQRESWQHRHRNSRCHARRIMAAVAVGVEGGR